MADERMTLFVDASWCPGSRYGGWGAWAKRAGWARGELFGGAFKAKFHSSSDAELGAIANALVTAARADWLVGIDLVMVQSDSMAALAVLRDGIEGTRDNAHAEGLALHVQGPQGSDNAHRTKALAAIQSVVDVTGIRLEVRHVKGHAKGETTRSAVNEACDKLARWHMRARRAIGNPEGRAARRAKRRRAKAKTDNPA